ncbi:hypothetical protein SAMN05445850_8034 [Paraburkholderia tuberum]|uniref:Uncharacterized protein n=1 Tax=Paraburkholderia tuberum TaxID=157910 RepID=A0A1H1KIU3_9BURK|nr:hypothetical protein SAMN05445850_8034 [Paraburkholderia tuberum]
MNALEQWRSRPLQVSVLDRCDECGELKEDVQKRVNYWPNITAVCSGKCFTEMTARFKSGLHERGLIRQLWLIMAAHFFRSWSVHESIR